MHRSRRETTPAGAAWALAARQHGVVSRAQLLELGMTGKAIGHRLAKRRLFPVHRGVYVVGRPEISRHGRWLAAVLACGPGAMLSHRSAAALWRIAPERPGRIEVSVPGPPRRRPGIVVHRRRVDLRRVHRAGVPTTDPVDTLLDLAMCAGVRTLEAAINAADKLDLVDPDELRSAVSRRPGRAGAPALRSLLDRRTFTLTDSELERRFLPLVRRAGLPLPLTGRRVNGYKVDFYWPDLGLVVETDGLRYHRTPAQQAKDRIRDQRHSATGLTPLRFTHGQIRYEPAAVRATLAAVAERLRRRP